MSSFCNMCGRPRSGTARFCDGCGAEFTDPPAAQDDSGAPTVDAARLGPPPDATRADPAVGATRFDRPGTEPDPFASWYQDGAPGAVPGNAGEGWADGTWQPTQAVGATPARFQPPPQALSGFPPPPPAQSAPPYPPAGRPSRRGRGGLFVALAAIVVLAAGGGAYAVAHSLGKHSTTPPSTGGGAPAGGTTSAGGSTPTRGSASSGGPTQATTPASSPTPSPSLSLVSVGPGVTSSAAVPPVETLLSHYFHGINSRDYAEYASTLNPAQRAKQSQTTFAKGYATTTDSAMTLTNLASDGAGGLVATVTFTSHQSPAQSVDHSACNDWTLNLYLVAQGTGYLIGPAPSGYQPTHADC